MPAPALSIFTREGSAIVAEIRGLLNSSGANATGKTSASLEVTASDERLLITGGKAFGFMRKEFSYVAAGRGPGGTPPYANIHEWAVARGIVSNDNTNKTIRRVNAIRYGIAKKGTVLHQENTTRDIYQSVIDDARVESIIDQVEGVYAEQTLSEIVKAFRNV
jgi:hypothetical protein